MLNSLIRMSVTRTLSFVILVACTAASGSRPKSRATTASPSTPNVILITLDTTRADRMGFLGSQLGLTPNLDRVGHDGAVFTRAYSQVPLTPPSHATILTGTYPQFNHLNDFGAKLPKDLPYLSDILHLRGYKTAAFVSSIILDPIQGSAPGFDRGFDVYDAGFHIRRPGEDRYQTIERRADQVVGRALAWLNGHSNRPFFLWLHFYDAHDPYDPPEPFKTRYAGAPYDGEIASMDAALGSFFEQLRSKGLYDDAVIAIMADHGESLGEHGEKAHGVFLYDETIHVPLLFKFPKQRFEGTRVTTRAGLVDVCPTILQNIGIPIPKVMQGESLMAMISAAASGERALAERPAFAETDYPRKAFGWSSMRSLRTGKYLFIEAPRTELYDQGSDPWAKDDLSMTNRAVTETLTTQLDTFRQRTSSMVPDSQTPADPQAQEKLSALGYVASADVKPGPGIADTGADPKDKIGIANLLHDAILDIEETQYNDAIPKLEQVLRTESGIPVAYMELGTAYSFLKDYDKALPILRKAVEMRPDVLLSQYELGLALSETGDWENSVPHFEAAVNKNPKWPALHFSLAAAYARVGRSNDARRELETTLKLEPDNYRANLVLGRMLTLQGKPALGLTSLKKALKLQPNDVNVHLFLADAYERLGQKANADRERAAAGRLKSAGQR